LACIAAPHWLQNLALSVASVPQDGQNAMVVSSFHNLLTRLPPIFLIAVSFYQPAGAGNRTRRSPVMKAKVLGIILAIVVAAGSVGIGLAQRAPASGKSGDRIELPSPKTEGGMSLAEALAQRRSIRRFTGQALTTNQLSQLCWSAQGITHQGNRRTAPSAGATYPLRVYVSTPEGVFVYHPDKHALEQVSSNDVRAGIARNSNQEWQADAGAIFVVCADVAITAARYKERAGRFVWQETGHVAQNVLLQATALDLGATPVGATDDAALARLLHLPRPWEVMYVLPVGVPK
jgi:SagB-type dehydrogenase family enzyme